MCPRSLALGWDYINVFRSCGTLRSTLVPDLSYYICLVHLSQPSNHTHNHTDKQHTHKQHTHKQCTHKQHAHPENTWCGTNCWLVSSLCVTHSHIHVGPFLWPFTCIHSPIHLYCPTYVAHVLVIVTYRPTYVAHVLVIVTYSSLSSYLCCPCSCHSVPDVSNRWNGIWNRTMGWKMEWNSEHTQLQLTCVTGAAQSRLNYFVYL